MASEGLEEEFKSGVEGEDGLMEVRSEDGPETVVRAENAVLGDLVGAKFRDGKLVRGGVESAGRLGGPKAAAEAEKIAEEDLAETEALEGEAELAVKKAATLGEDQEPGAAGNAAETRTEKEEAKPEPGMKLEVAREAWNNDQTRLEGLRNNERRLALFLLNDRISDRSIRAIDVPGSGVIKRPDGTSVKIERIPGPKGDWVDEEGNPLDPDQSNEAELQFRADIGRRIQISKDAQRELGVRMATHRNEYYAALNEVRAVERAREKAESPDVDQQPEAGPAIDFEREADPDRERRLAILESAGFFSYPHSENFGSQTEQIPAPDELRSGLTERAQERTTAITALLRAILEALLKRKDTASGAEDPRAGKLQGLMSRIGKALGRFKDKLLKGSERNQ